MRVAHGIFVKFSALFVVFVSTAAFAKVHTSFVGAWSESSSVQSAVHRFDRQLNQAVERKADGQNYRDPILSMNYARLVASHELSLATKNQGSVSTSKQTVTRLAEAIHRSLVFQQSIFDVTDTATNGPLTMARFFPTVKPQGNIFGDEFPAGTWALTFDDGPSPVYSPVVLHNLQVHGMKATFCEVAQMAQAYPAMAKEIHDAGMGMCNHSFSHADLARATPAQLNHEIVDSTRVLTAIWGEAPRFFRLPYGAGLHDNSVRSLIAQEGMISLYWNVDSLDWADKNPESILARVTKEMALHRAGVVLFHDIHPQSVAASELVMDRYSKAFHWATVPQIVDQMNNSSLVRY